METVAFLNPVLVGTSNGINDITTGSTITSTTNITSTLSQSSSDNPNGNNVQQHAAELGEKIDLEVGKSCLNNTKTETEEIVQTNVDTKGKLNSNADLKSPVPNFRVEGSGAGDSSITVAVNSFTSAVPLSNSSSCVVDCDTRTCGEGPGSGSGPVSVQSSEEMKLSLVSWYSEPDDPSRINIGDSTTSSCCGESTPLHLQNGRQAISMTGNLLSKCGSEEKENKTPEPESSSTLPPQQDVSNSRESVLTFVNGDSKHDDVNEKNLNSKPSQRIKIHVQLLEENASSEYFQGTPHSCNNNRKPPGSHDSQTPGLRNGKPECHRCTRRSKSGSNTPATAGMHHHQQSRSRTPANRRVVQSSKSSTELKKPIKSILKNDTKGSGGSGSGSDNKSSMDSLGSADIRMTTPLMTRSDSGTRAKFNLNHQIYSDTPTSCSGDDKIVSKLRRIEKYATLRLRKNARVKPLDLSDTDGNHSSSGGSKVGTPSGPIDLMTKSMSFLEKSSNRGDSVSLPYGASLSANSTLKRQGSLRVKKGNTVWEPCVTRTTTLRLQKMQEAKAKSGGSGYSAGSGHSGSAHSGSGDSIHHLPQFSSSSYHHGFSGGVHTPTNKSQTTPSSASKEPKSVGVKVFAKLSSAFGQTTSSNQKRLKQEKAIQTEPSINSNSTCTNILDENLTGTSLSPIPTVDAAADLTDRIRQLEKLANRYRNTALRFQCEYEKSEAKKTELAKQFQEAQTETNEMIEFLQAEKSTLAESLLEIEIEARKWRDEIELTKHEAQSRCSSLVRLSEQHKQEALKAQTLLKRMESQFNVMISQLSSQISDGASSIYLTRQKVNSLTDSLLKTYKVPQEFLNSSAEPNSTLGLGVSDADLSSSLLLPLITSLSTTFPVSVTDTFTTKKNSGSSKTSPVNLHPVAEPTVKELASTECKASTTLTGSTSLQNLNQAILDREAAERLGLDDMTPCHYDTLIGSSPDDDHLSLKHEIAELSTSIAKLLLVIRVIVIHCDKRVSTVASSILQCLQSMEDDKVGNIPEMAQVQKSLEAWRDNGSTSNTGSTINGSPPCKSSATNISSTLHLGNTHTSPA